MQVILNQDVEKIGQRGDIVDVSRGYVRNFLVPRGLAEVATSGKLEEARRSMEESEERNRRLAERAEEISGILNKSVITIEARTGEDERLSVLSRLPTSPTRSKGPAASASTDVASASKSP